MIVNELRFAPHRCITTGQTEDPRGFIDTGVTIDDVHPQTGYHAYISVGWVRDMSRKHCDMVSKQVLRQAQTRIAELVAQLERYEGVEDALRPLIEQRAETLALELAVSAEEPEPVEVTA